MLGWHDPELPAKGVVGYSPDVCRSLCRTQGRATQSLRQYNVFPAAGRSVGGLLTDFSC